jgi:hypothetical protein
MFLFGSVRVARCINSLRTPAWPRTFLVRLHGYHRPSLGEPARAIRLFVGSDGRTRHLDSQRVGVWVSLPPPPETTRMIAARAVSSVARCRAPALPDYSRCPIRSWPVAVRPLILFRLSDRALRLCLSDYGTHRFEVTLDRGAGARTSIERSGHQAALSRYFKASRNCASKPHARCRRALSARVSS